MPTRYRHTPPRHRRTLQLYGAGGWKDTDDLRMGALTEEEIRRVIARETGGFVWWGTRAALDSWMINDVEIPAALERASAEPLYPFVPVFVDLNPGENREEILGALGDHAEDILGRNGVVRKGLEPADAFRRRIARRYVRDAIGSLPADPLLVALRALSEPNGEHDLTFDWRSVFQGRSRLLNDEALPALVDVLSNARDAFQAREGSPEVMLDSDLPLPLAFLVGYEWRITTRVRLQVWQRTGSSYAWVEADGPTIAAPESVTERLDREGPVVIAVSCKEPLYEIAKRYAVEQSASELVTLYAPGLLDASQMRSLARKAADLLRDSNARGMQKHLLIRGPEAVATMIGAASNACGPVTVPFWNGTGYVSPIVVGP